MDPLYSYSVGIAVCFPHTSFLTLTITMYLVATQKRLTLRSCDICKKLLNCPCSLLQSHRCTQWTASGALSPQQLLSLLGFPPTCQDLMHGPSLSCQGGRVLHAPWGMHLTWGTCKRSPETPACSIHRNCRIANPLRSQHHSEWHPGDAASPSHQKYSWGTGLHDRASLPQHATAWAANSLVRTVPIHSQRTRTIMHTP